MSMSLMDDSPLVDPFGRRITYLRVSIVDRCNLKCLYCMPNVRVSKLQREAILRLEEIIEVVRVSTKLGIAKFRITGGEPLIRKGAVKIVREIAAMGRVEKVALTTNGQRLAKYAARLKEVGLSGVNVSLDTLDPLLYRRITRGGDIAPVLEGIDTALDAGLTVKINTVLMGSADSRTIRGWIRFAKEKEIEIRFIERMGFEHTVPFVENSLVLEAIENGYRVHSAPRDRNSPHVRRIEVEGAHIGFISPRSESFCGDCNKLRLTAAGHLRACLASETHVNLKAILRAPHTDIDIARAFRKAVHLKPNKGPWTASGDMWRV
jgi:cyclic pyranopterin phosphate synthase